MGVLGGVKGAGADAGSQLVLQGDSTYDPGRTVAFGIWSGTYCGLVLYLLYNRFYPVAFPLTTAAGVVHPHMRRHVVGMVAFDNFVSSPWFFIPSYYVVREALREFSAVLELAPARTVRTALGTYRNEFWSCMSLTWSMWVPIHFVTFGGLVPQHLRVHFTAVCSFFTLMMTSKLQSWLEKKRPAQEQRVVAVSPSQV